MPDLLDDGDTDQLAGAGFLFDDMLGPGADEAETTHRPNARALRIQAKRAMLRIEREQQARDVLKGLPAAGHQVHIVSAAKFDFWTWCPVMIDWLGKTDHFYCSTWTLSRNNARELFGLVDEGKIPAASCVILTGTYFKRRESSVYSYLVEGLRNRGGRYRAFSNHAKVLLIANARRRAWLTIEGSANLTSNPRLEQYVITNDRRLHDFHRGWMDEVLAATGRGYHD